MTQKTSPESLLKLEREPVEGIEIADGIFQTSSGIVRIPRARRLEEQRKQTAEKLQQKPKEVPRREPAREPQRLPVRRHQGQSVIFETPVGQISGIFDPVIENDNWVILGKTEMSFVPKSYREDASLRFRIKARDVSDCNVVFTGCEFTDPHYEQTYLIFMKV